VKLNEGFILTERRHELCDAVVEIPHAYFSSSRTQHWRGHLPEPHHGSDHFRKRQRRQSAAARSFAAKRRAISGLRMSNVPTCFLDRGAGQKTHA